MSLVIIIGLPGSGKTFLSKKYSEYVIFDDFIDNYFSGQVVNELNKIKNGNKVCLIDPRLCLPNIFKRYMIEFQKYVNNDNILLILFENNPQQCIKNVANRTDGKRNIESTIFKYSQVYDTENYTKYKNEVISVYKPT